MDSQPLDHQGSPIMLSFLGNSIHLIRSFLKIPKNIRLGNTLFFFMLPSFLWEAILRKKAAWVLQMPPHGDSLCFPPSSGIQVNLNVDLLKLDTPLHLASFSLLKCQNEGTLVQDGKIEYPHSSFNIRFLSHLQSFNSLGNNPISTTTLSEWRISVLTLNPEKSFYVKTLY